MKQNPDNPDIVALASSFYGSATLFAAVECGLFAELSKRPATTVAELATTLHCDQRGLQLLLNGCVALGLLEFTADGAYRNSPASEMMLVPGAAHDLTQAISYNQDVYQAWGKLPELVRSGKPVEPPARHLGDDPVRTRRFVLSMDGRARGIGRAVVPLLQLTGVKQLLDIGGGPGTYAMLMAGAYPELHATVIDLPPVAAVARELIDAAGLSTRVSTLPGDYHTTPFPDDQDAVTIFGVLHQESTAAIKTILQRAYAALRPGGTIHILDMMTDATHTRPTFSALFAINMALTTHNGWVFAVTEISEWLQEAGFSAVSSRELPPPMPHTLVTARKD